jgi:hypothetical protein
MSVLLPATKALLAGVRPHAPYFSNLITAEMFDAEHTRGSLTLLPHGDGGYVVFDRDAPIGRGVLEGPFAKLADAHAAVERFAAARAPRPQAAERAT